MPWFLAAAFICFCLILPQAGLAAWSGDPISVSMDPGKQCRPQVVYDGSGGYYVAWQDFEAEGVFAQHYGVNGDPTWDGPVRLGGGSGSYQQEAAADGSGGLLVAWYDNNLSYTVVQGIDIDGNIAWDEGGVAVLNDDEPWIAADGTGGAIVMSYYGLVNRVAADGTLPWADADEPLEYSTDSWATKIVSDGAGGAILLWEEGDLVDGVVVQRIDSNGNFVWNDGDPLQLSAEGSYPDCPRLIPDGAGGAIVAWYDSSDTVWSQKIDADGQIQWPAGGKAVATSNDPWPVDLASDGSGGAFITWGDWEDDTVYAQYIDANGDIVWDDMVALTSEGDLYDIANHPHNTVEDGMGGFITTWTNPGEEIKAQRCDAAGNLIWTATGAVIAAGNSIYYDPKLTSNGQGGAVAVWVDSLDDTDEDIFMQGVNAQGVTGDPGYVPEVPAVDTTTSSNWPTCFISTLMGN